MRRKRCFIIDVRNYISSQIIKDILYNEICEYGDRFDNMKIHKFYSEKFAAIYCLVYRLNRSEPELVRAAKNAYFEYKRYNIEKLIDYGVRKFSISGIHNISHSSTILNLFSIGELSKKEIVKISTKKGYTRLLDFFIKHGEKIKFPFDHLVNYAKDGNLEKIKHLIELGIPYTSNGGILLYTASQHGRLEIVEYLVELGMDVHIYDDFSLQLASEYGHTETVKFLLEKGANIHANNDYAVKAAFENNRSHTLEVLLKNGAPVKSLFGDLWEETKLLGRNESIYVVENFLNGK